MANSMLILLVFAGFVDSINGQVFAPNISNSTGDYWISQDNSDFGYGEINCTSTGLCHIQCTHKYACRNSVINCGNATECIIECNSQYACRQAEFSSSADRTSLTCIGSRSCWYLGIDHIKSTVFNWWCGGDTFSCNDINYYLSTPSFIEAINFTWTCAHSFSCSGVDNLNISVNRMVFEATGDYCCDEFDGISMSLTDYALWKCIADRTCENINNITYPTVFEPICAAPGTCIFNPSYPRRIITPTVDTASQQIWNTANEYDFTYSIINCTHDVLCSFNCDVVNSCPNTLFYCHNVAECNVNCNGEGACAGSSVYPSTGNTVISCESSGGWNCEAMKVYNNYDDYPLSTVLLTCGGSFSCYQFILYGNRSAQFKILCTDSAIGCDITLFSALPIPTSQVYNSTGEYYFNAGSYLNYTCNHSELCYIDCSGGSCTKSYIDCGNAVECSVLCVAKAPKACDNMQITATDNDIYSFECTGDDSWACTRSHHYITNVNTVNIKCYGDRAWYCDANQFNILSGDDVNINMECDDNCDEFTFNIDNVKNGVINCGDNQCNSGTFNIKSGDNYTVICGANGCLGLSITQIIDSSSNFTDIYGLTANCKELNSCSSVNVCIYPQNMFNYCCGNNNGLCSFIYCDSMNNTDNINQIQCDSMDNTETTAAVTTDASTTEASTYTAEESTTEASTTESQVAEASTTEASTPEVSTTEASTTESPMPEASTTEASTPEVSTTEASTTEPLIAKASTTESHMTEASTAEASTTESPMPQASTTEASPRTEPVTTARIVQVTETTITETTVTFANIDSTPSLQYIMSFVSFFIFVMPFI